LLWVPKEPMITAETMSVGSDQIGYPTFISSTYGPLRDISLLDRNTPRTLGHNAASGIPLRAVLDGGTAKSQQPGRPTKSNWGTPRIAQARQKQRLHISDCG